MRKSFQKEKTFIENENTQQTDEKRKSSGKTPKQRLEKWAEIVANS